MADLTNAELAELNMNHLAAAPFGNRVVGAVTGADGAVSYRTWRGAWSPWRKLGGFLTSGPAVAVDARGRVTVFARGGDNALWYRAGDGTSWSEWASLDGVLTSAPAAVHLPDGRLMVIVRGIGLDLWQRTYDGSAWGDWSSLGGHLTSAPAAAVAPDGRLMVFARGGDGAIWHLSHHQGRWSPWSSLDGAITSAPSAALVGGALAVFARGLDGGVWHRRYDGAWGDWASLNGTLRSSPTAVREASGRTLLFGVGADDALWCARHDDAWKPWAFVGSAAPAPSPLDDPQLRAIAERLAAPLLLAVEKAVAHAIDPGAFPMPASADALERAFATRLQRIPSDRRQRVIERMRPHVMAAPEVRRARYGDLAAVRLDAATPVDAQAKAIAVPDAMKVSPDRLQQLLAAAALPTAGGFVPQDEGTLTLKVVAMKCVDLTDPESDNDEVALGGILIGPPSSGSDGPTEATIVQGTVSRTFTFGRDGIGYPMMPPHVVGHIPITGSGPYLATLFLTEMDYGQFPEWLDQAFNYVHRMGQQIGAYYLTGVTGPFAPLAVSVANCVSDFVFAEVTSFVREWWEDDVFPPFTWGIVLPAPTAPQRIDFAGFGGHYTVQVEWDSHGLFLPFAAEAPPSTLPAMTFTCQEQGIFQSVATDDAGTEAWATTAPTAPDHDGAVALPNRVRRVGREWLPGSLAQVAVGAPDKIWGVDAEGRVFRWRGSEFVQVRGELRHVSVSADGAVLGVSKKSGRVLRWRGEDLQRPATLDWEATDLVARKVAVGSASEVWAISKGGLAYRWNGQGFALQPGSVGLKDIAVGKDGTVCGIDGQWRLCFWTGSKWQERDTHPRVLRSVAVSNQRTIWAVSGSGAIWKYDDRPR